MLGQWLRRADIGQKRQRCSSCGLWQQRESWEFGKGGDRPLRGISGESSNAGAPPGIVARDWGTSMLGGSDGVGVRSAGVDVSGALSGVEARRSRRFIFESFFLIDENLEWPLVVGAGLEWPLLGVGAGASASLGFMGAPAEGDG